MQTQRGTSAGQIHNLKILPLHTMSPTGADRLHARFLSGKPGSIALVLIRFALHIGDLGWSKKTIGEPLPVPFDCRANAVDFRYIDPRTDNVTPTPVVVIVRRPCLTPLVEIRASAILRTSPALPFTTRTSRQLLWSRWTCSVERIW